MMRRLEIAEMSPKYFGGHRTGAIQFKILRPGDPSTPRSARRGGTEANANGATEIKYENFKEIDYGMEGTRFARGTEEHSKESEQRDAFGSLGSNAMAIACIGNFREIVIAGTAYQFVLLGVCCIS